MIELSVVMPCLNEELTVATCICKALKSMDDLGISGEVVIADNGSTDASCQKALDAGARVVHVREKGYGAALRGGIMAARGRFIIMGDSDDSYDFSRLGPFVEKLREGYDLVMGNRFAGGISQGAMPMLHKYLGNPVLSFIGRLLFPSQIKDFHCGLRGFTKKAFVDMRVQTTGMEFASEIVVKATILRLKICEVPTTLSPDGRDRPPHLRSWRDGWRHLRFLLLYSPRWLFLYPGFLLMSIGAVLGSALFFGHIRIGPLEIREHTMIFCVAFILLGYQMVLFAIITKAYCLTHGLHPNTSICQTTFSHVRLENGLILASVFFLLGLLAGGYALLVWSQNNFGPLPPNLLLNWVSISTTLLCVGSQTAFASFFIGIFGLQTNSIQVKENPDEFTDSKN